MVVKKVVMWAVVKVGKMVELMAMIQVAMWAEKRVDLTAV